MRLRYQTVDVFTRFGGNPLAVVLEADGLSTAQMQVVAREFNYSETSFVLRPSDPRHTARVRIFTPMTEVPFAGHPNVGTAFVLAGLGVSTGPEGAYWFEEAAGLVRASLAIEDGELRQVWLTAPQPLRLGRSFAPEAVARCLSLTEAEIRCDRHPPRVASVGLPFVVAEIADRAALARARADATAFAALLPDDGADAIYLYCRETDARDGAVDFSARMFAPFDGLPEDPATGSATAAACALLTALDGPAPRRFEVAQGIDMGRPSLISAEVTAAAVRVGGPCVPVMAGEMRI